MVHKIGYIGFGSMGGGYHYDTTLRDDNNFEAVAVYDVRESQRALAESRGLKAFDNLKDFLDSKLFDVVVVATSNNHHCEMTCAALEAGYDVLCEKPVAMNVEEAEKMYDTAKRLGRIFMVHQNRRFDKNYLLAKKAIYQGLIGKPYQLESRVQYGGRGCPVGWRGFEDHGGGMLFDWEIHIVDQMIDLVGEPVKDVYAKLHNVNSNNVDAYANITITFESGLKAVCDVNMFACIGLPRFACYGDMGALLIDGDEAKLRRLKDKEFYETAWEAYPDGKNIVLRRMKDVRSSGFEEMDLNEKYPDIVQDWATFYKQFEAVLDRVEDVFVTKNQVIEVMRVIEAAVESNRTGEVVHLG